MNVSNERERIKCIILSWYNKVVPHNFEARLNYSIQEIEEVYNTLYNVTGKYLFKDYKTLEFKNYG